MNKLRRAVITASVAVVLLVILALATSIFRTRSAADPILLAARAVNSSNPAVVGQAALSLSNQPAAIPRLIEIVRQQESWLAKATLSISRKLPAHLSSRVLAATHAEEIKHDRVAAALALGVLQTTNSTALSALCQALDHGNDELSAAAATALARIGPASLPCLTNALQSPISWTRSMAVFALGTMRDPPATAIPPLILRLSDPALQISSQAAYALSRFGRTAVPALSIALQSTNELTRERAAQSLRSLGPVAYAALPQLTAALADPSSLVRAQAAGALANFGPIAKPAVAALQNALNDPSLEVRQQAQVALDQIGKK